MSSLALALIWLAGCQAPRDTGAAQDSEVTGWNTGVETGEDTGDTGSNLGELSFSLLDSAPLDFGATWCGFGYDGEQVVISAEQGGTIEVAPFSLEGVRLAHQQVVADLSDTLDGDRIADHKHAFVDGHHFIVFSNAGTGSGGQLSLLKLDENLARVDLIRVVEDDAPTNDMFLVSDGLTLSVGKFEPAVGHRVFQFDTDLQLLDTVSIGGEDAMHANGAAAVWAEGAYHLLAPMTLMPGGNREYNHFVFDAHWGLVAGPETVLEQDFLGMVTALEFEEETRQFIAHYNVDEGGLGGDIRRVIFGANWAVRSNETVAEGRFARPHSVLLPDALWLGWDADAQVWLSRYALEVVPADQW
jgi:hypothetical protein